MRNRKKKKKRTSSLPTVTSGMVVATPSQTPENRCSENGIYAVYLYRQREIKIPPFLPPFILSVEKLQARVWKWFLCQSAYGSFIYGSPITEYYFTFSIIV